MSLKITHPHFPVSKLICVFFIVLLTSTLSIAQPGITWISRTTPVDNNWFAVTYGNGLFVAVSGTGGTNRVMTSPDGINWTNRTSPDNNWLTIAYGNDIFVAVASSGTGNRVMTSPDGITWTSRISAADNLWTAVTFGNGLFVAVGQSGIGTRVMTSSDGITWTLRSSAADNTWTNVTYGNELFVAVGMSGAGNRVMTSPDGIAWTIRASAADNGWLSVIYANSLFVAVAGSGVAGSRVMTSPDGITWTLRTTPADNAWRSLAYGSGLYVAVASTGTGNRVMTSPDGTTWTIRTSAADNFWRAVAYANGIFVAVAQTGAGNRAMSSGTLSTLPVQWISFTVKNINNKNELRWQTGNEINNLRFEIERSDKGVSFTKIGEVAGAVNSSSTTEYSFIDNTPISGINYYRLKQVDIDERSEYSRIVAVENTTREFSVYPNPVYNKLVVAGLKETTKPYRYIITNPSGQTVLAGVLPADNSIYIESLPRGLYYLSIDGVTRKIDKR